MKLRPPIIAALLAAALGLATAPISAGGRGVGAMGPHYVLSSGPSVPLGAHRVYRLHRQDYHRHSTHHRHPYRHHVHRHRDRHRY